MSLWKNYKPFIVKSQYKPHRQGQTIADFKALTDYDTGKVFCFKVTVNGEDHFFKTFEEAMIFCDLNDFYVDSRDWANPSIGISQIFASLHILNYLHILN